MHCVESRITSILITLEVLLCMASAIDIRREPNYNDNQVKAVATIDHCKGNDPFPAPNSPSNYFQCFEIPDGYVLILFECPSGGIYEDVFKSCILGPTTTETIPDQTTYQNVTEMTSEPSTEKPDLEITTQAAVTTTPARYLCENEGIFADPFDPLKYYRCIEILAHLYYYVYTCPPTSCYDTTLQLCRIGICTIDSSTQATPTESTDEVQCTVDEEFEDPSLCTSFYKCVEVGSSTHQYRFNCPMGSYYGGLTLGCVFGNCPETTEPPPTIGSDATTVDSTQETHETTVGPTHETNETAVGPTHETNETAVGSTHETNETAVGPTHETNETAVGPTHETNETAVGSTHETHETTVGPTHETHETTVGPTHETVVDSTHEPHETTEGSTHETTISPSIETTTRESTIIATTITQEIITTPVVPISCTAAGIFPNPNSCQSYYKCLQITGIWHVYMFSCPPGSFYSPNPAGCLLGDCPTPDITTTESTTIQHSTSTDIITEGTTPQKTSSTTEEELTTTEPSTTILTTTTTTTFLPTTPAPFRCTIAGQYIDPIDCTRYYTCHISNGTIFTYSFRCPTGTFFNPVTRICTNGNCPNV